MKTNVKLGSPEAEKLKRLQAFFDELDRLNSLYQKAVEETHSLRAQIQLLKERKRAIIEDGEEI